MPAKNPRLTPKIRDLVASDRRVQRPVGRLTAVHVEALISVARHTRTFDVPVRAPNALIALAEGRPDAAMPVLTDVLIDDDAPSEDRVAAARGLGLISTTEAASSLLAAARDRNPRVQQAVLASLGTFAGPEAVVELEAVEAVDVHARRQLDFTRALIAHRHGLDGPFLPAAPNSVVQLDGRSKTTEVSLRAKTAAATQSDVDKLTGPTYGVEFATRGYDLRCGSKEWTAFVNRDLGRSFASLTQLGARPWIAAILGWWYPERFRATTQYVVLARPLNDGAHLDVVRTDGEIVYAGDAKLSGTETFFSIADVDRRGASPVRLTGRLGPNGVELDVALAAPLRLGARSTELVQPQGTS